MPPEPTDARAAAVLREQLGLELGSFGATMRRRIEGLVQGSSLADAHLLQALEDTCSIPETYFFRHAEQWRSLGRWLAQRDRPEAPLRAWSAGTATGEEAYSLACFLRRATGHAPEVLGTDMSASALARAQGASYGPWSLRELDVERALDLFDEDDPGYVVREEHRACVRFARLNLVVDPFPQALDVVFCRNVFLYFEPEAAAAVLRRFAAALLPTGVLVLGPFDPAASVAARIFEPIEGHAGFFRKRTKAHESARPRRSSARPQRATPRVATIPPLPPLEAWQGLAIDDALDDVVQLCEGERARQPLDSSVHLRATLAYWDVGLDRHALVCARAAYFLDASSPVTQSIFGVALARSGDRARALPVLREARRALGDPRSRPDPALETLDLRLLVESELGACRAP